MRIFTNYKSALLKKIYAGPPLGADKLDTLWPLFLGGALFALLDVGLKLREPARAVMLALLLAPGVAWFGWVMFHEYRAFRLWLTHRKTPSGRRDDE